MKIAILMNSNSYAGREYIKTLKLARIAADVITIGHFPVIDEEENQRCGGNWNPPPESELICNLNTYHFTSLKDKELISFLNESNYTLGIQGGTGIIRNEIINSFELGILNFHPGDLPFYRGCSAPEWQLYENKNIISTCHLIDEGIDTGKIVAKIQLEVSFDSYELFRASIYPETAKFLVKIINAIIKNPEIINQSKPQDETNAIYRKYIGSSKIEELKIRLLKDNKNK